MEIELLQQDSMAQEPAATREPGRAAFFLSLTAVVLGAGVSVIGLAFPTVYGGKTWSAMGLGNDLVTLVVAVPVLAWSLIASARGFARGRLIWLGTLYYMFYNYAFYVFGLPVTKLYLPLIAVFTVSGYALALGMGQLDADAIGRRFRSRTPAKPIASYLFLWAAMVSGLWISQWVKFVFTGTVPQINGDPNAYRMIAAVDLCFMVSLLIPAACWLWARRPWGYVLGVVLNVQGALYMMVMIAVCLAGWRLTPGSHLVSWWFISCIVSCVASLLCLCGLLLNLEREPAAH